MGTQVNDTSDTTAIAVTPDQAPRRNALMRAFAQAEQVVSKLHAVPTDVDVHGDPRGVHRVRLYFSQNRAGVAEFAVTFAAEVTDLPSYSGVGAYIEARTNYQGVEVIAWTLLDAVTVEDEPAAEERVETEQAVQAVEG